MLERSQPFAHLPSFPLLPAEPLPHSETSFFINRLSSLATHLRLWDLPVLVLALSLLIPIWQVVPAFEILHPICSSAALVRSQIIVPPTLLPQPRAQPMAVHPGSKGLRLSPCFCSVILSSPHHIFCLMVTRWLLPFQISSLHLRQNIWEKEARNTVSILRKEKLPPKSSAYDSLAKSFTR